jgi:hypothetical protein
MSKKKDSRNRIGKELREGPAKQYMTSVTAPPVERREMEHTASDKPENGAASMRGDKGFQENIYRLCGETGVAPSTARRWLMRMLGHEQGPWTPGSKSRGFNALTERALTEACTKLGIGAADGEGAL